MRTSQPLPDSVDVEKPKLFKHAVGASMVSEKYGAFSRIGGNLAYALHFPIKGDIKGSLGIAGGVSRFGIDQTKIELSTPEDNTYFNFGNFVESTMVIELKAGVMAYNKNFFIGYSAAQLMQNSVNFDSNGSDSKFVIHHFLAGRYHFDLNDFGIAPGVILKYMNPAPFSIEANLLADYRNKIWIGASYRHDDAIVGLIGFNINDMIRVGYSYDFTIADLGDYNANNIESGSHEVTLGIMINQFW